MGSLCSCICGEKSAEIDRVKDGQAETIPKRKSAQSLNADEEVAANHVNDNQSTNTAEQITIVHASSEIIDEDLTKQITEAIEKYVLTLSDAYKARHAYIVNTMQNSSPQQYFGLLFSDYPEKNGLLVKEMARKEVTSEEVQQKLVNQINEQIDSTFQSRTANWNDGDKQAARTDVQNLIEKNVKEAFERVTFD